MLRKLAVLAICVAALVALPANAAKPDADVPVTIMTQNMDDGTDQTYIIAALLGAIPVSTWGPPSISPTSSCSIPPSSCVPA